MRLTERLNQSCFWGASMIRFVSAHFPQEHQKMPADCLLEQNQSISQQESISADTWGSVVSVYNWKCICHCCFTSWMCHQQLDILWVLLSDFRDKVTIKVCQKESWFSNKVLLSFFKMYPHFSVLHVFYLWLVFLHKLESFLKYSLSHKRTGCILELWRGIWTSMFVFVWLKGQRSVNRGEALIILLLFQFSSSSQEPLTLLLHLNKPHFTKQPSPWPHPCWRKSTSIIFSSVLPITVVIVCVCVHVYGGDLHKAY